MNALALPSIAEAKLPAVYEHAKASLAECSRIDECADWANKAEAMASYAKQADDDALFAMATKIKARAIRRCGELLREIPDAKGRPINGGGAPTISRRSVAAEAGLSKDQQVTATRVARIPEPEFEELVESDAPPTVTTLAERGTQKKPSALSDLKGRSEKDFKACTAALGWIRDLLSFAQATDPSAVVRGASIAERQRLTVQVPQLLGWLSDLLDEAKDNDDEA